MLKALRAGFYALIVFLCVSVAKGQVATGIYNYGTYDTPGLDSINVGNLNVHLNLPVLNKAGRGLPFYYNLSYDSSIWSPTSSSGLKSWTPVQNFGWNGQTDGPMGYLTYQSFSGQCPMDGGGTEIYHYRTAYIYTDAFGVSHSFPVTVLVGVDPNDCSGITPGPASATAADGSGYSLTASSTSNSVTTKAQAKINPPVLGVQTAGSIQDLNGNQISLSSGAFEDTTGKTALTVAGGAPNPLTMTYTDAKGNPQVVSITYTTYTVQTAFGCSGVTEYGPTPTSLVNTIQFPDGSTYTFSYEPTPGVSGKVTGRVASIQLPQTGAISYTYTGGNNGIECADGSSAGLTRKLTTSAGSAASTWTYSRTIGSGSTQTAVVDGLTNNKTYSFTVVGDQPYETSRSIYDHSVGSVPVLARTTCYNSTSGSSPCTTSSFSLPVTQIDAYETLNGVETHGWTTTYNTYGSVVGTLIYDYASGSSARGSLLSSQLATYGYSIPTLPTQVTVSDGTNGNMAGKTVYTYDQTTPTTSSGIPQHVAEGSVRGNLTGETLYASAGTSYALTATYEDTGSLLTSTTPTGTTTLSYDPTFVYNTGASLPTPSSGIALSVSAGYDTSYTGLPQSSTDPNTQQTSIPTYDPVLRPTEIDFPDGGKTNWTYSPTTVTTISEQSSNSSTNYEMQLDGYARQSRTATATDPNGDSFYQTDTCYDGNGNASFVSYRYQGVGLTGSKLCSGAGDIYTYDVLGRVTKIVRSNGETVSYTYTGRATEITDENSVKRITQIDGLGRTTIVCEITSVTLQGVAPVACGTDITGTTTGFLMTYAYSVANHTTTTTQGAQTGSYSRVFQTDWLGRPILVQEPESGKTNYSYAYNSTGLVVTRTRPKANQTNASVLTTTTTQYDALNRVISVIYNDNLTPNKQYDYDAVNSAMQWSETTTNLKGRMADIASGTGTSLTRSLFSYDPVGRVTTLWACAPSICGTSSQASRALSFGYDWTGALTSEYDGASGYIQYTRSVAGEVTAITNETYQGTGNPAALVSNVSNGPNGPLSYTLGNNLKTVYGYDTLGRLNAGGVCSGSPTSPSCSGGTPVYTFTDVVKGIRVTNASDSVLSKTLTYGYDDFNRLAALTVNSGTVQNFGYSFDRYGNRVGQTAPQGGNTFSVAVNAANNQFTTSGYAYDAAGNMTNDSFHSYKFDAEGNILSVDTGSTGLYVYDAMNRRVRTQSSAGNYEYLFDFAGRRTSTWIVSNNFANEGRIYWDGKQIAYRAYDGNTYFEHQDWLGTERLRTTYTGTVAADFVSLPWGDGYSANNVSGQGGQDTLDFAGLDRDPEDATSHAQFRNYSSAQGRWLSPDPYQGSYNLGNPQSLNRYAYVANNPLPVVDPLGLDGDGDVPCPPQNQSRSGFHHPRPTDDGDCVDQNNNGDDATSDGSDNPSDGPSYPPGTVLQDPNTLQLFIVGANGALIPYDPQTVTTNADENTCDLNDPVCQFQYQQLTGQNAR